MLHIVYFCFRLGYSIAQINNTVRQVKGEGRRVFSLTEPHLPLLYSVQYRASTVVEVQQAQGQLFQYCIICASTMRESPKQDSKRFNSQGRVYNLSMQYSLILLGIVCRSFDFATLEQSLLSLSQYMYTETRTHLIESKVLHICTVQCTYE